ncbi:uncharacterized protein LOC128680638 isoform X1 [Plodia interpunctella]|uniref:uncharacterized protein LOC128680638 isoform X1 n=1 Tax=Plodia interpunctella TaxID=58824 RepID=UPI0023682091|nr:uncharacterized protein LOC128680638 isoform X1 [Plodia interpunctella]
MTSHKIEDLHTALLDKLLSESGLECQRSLVESEISEIVPEETEEQVAAEEKAEGLAEALGEEEAATTVEEIEEQKPLIFPTPSLRRVLPDRIRQIEESNRIHVLPKVFNTNIDPQAIPKIAYTAPQKYIDILAEIVGCRKYKSSLGEFWFLDTLANLLRRAQNEEFDRPTQAVLILWFCEWMKEMQHFDAADRQRMLRRFKDNMLSAARFIAVANHLPTPDEAGVYYMSEEERVKSAVSSVVNESKHFVTFEGAAYECSLRDLTKIIHYIFDLFSTDYQYNLVRSVFTFTPEYFLIDSPYQIQRPKRIYAPLKIKPKKDKPKKEPKDKKGKKKEPDTEEYIALMELKARDEKEQEEMELKDMEDYNLRSHILPLGFAATDELFDKYWPPPTPEPEPEPVVVVKKGKGKK